MSHDSSYEGLWKNTFDSETPDSKFMAVLAKFMTSRTDGQTAEIEIRNIDIITKLNDSSLLFLYNSAF